MTQYEPMEVLTSVREPFNKNTLWIHPHDDLIEVKIYNKGWKVLFTTKDVGLTEVSKQQLETLVNEFKNSFNFKFKQEYGKHRAALLTLTNKNRELEIKVGELEAKLNKLIKRLGMLIAKH